MAAGDLLDLDSEEMTQSIALMDELGVVNDEEKAQLLKDSIADERRL